MQGMSVAVVSPVPLFQAATCHLMTVSMAFSFNNFEIEERLTKCNGKTSLSVIQDHGRLKAFQNEVCFRFFTCFMFFSHT